MKYSIISLLLLVAAHLHGQGLRVIAAAGNTVSGNGITLGYTIGETAIAQRTAANNQLREGFWQPGINSLVAVVDIAGMKSDIRVYPNPTGGQFTLDLGEGFPVSLQCTLFNALGAAVESVTIEEGQTATRMGDPGLENGLYLLQLQTPDGRTAHTFRVLKM